MKNKGVNAALIIGVILAVMIGGVATMYIAFQPGGIIAQQGGTLSETVVKPDSAYTVNINGYDLAADSLTEVYADLFVLDQDGNIIVSDGTGVNSTTAAYGDALSVYPSGADYYCEPVLGAEVNKNPTTISVDCYTPAAQASMVMKVYDDTMDELTAATNGSDENNYQLTLGSEQTERVTVRLGNEDSDSVYMYGGICVGWAGDVDEVEIVDGQGWEEIDMPKEVRDATWALTNDTSSDQTGDWGICYAPSDAVMLEEWQEQDLEFAITADSDDPTENTGDIVTFVALDESWNLANNQAFQGIHDGTENEDVGNMGAIDEGDELTTPNDSYISIAIECV